MATFLLEGTDTARLAQRPLTVSMTVTGTARARLVARVAAGISPVIEDRPDLVIVPFVDTEIVVSAVPADGARQFAENTLLYVSVAPDTRDVNVDDVQVAPHEVSGRESVDLLKIAPQGADIVLVTRIGGEDIPLSPLANRARVACRGALGVDAFGGELAVTAGCVIDISASMARFVADGTVGAASELFAGVAAAVAGAQPARIVLAGRHPSDVPTGPLAEVRTRVRDALEVSGFGVGADLDAAIAHVSEWAQYVVVITDSPISNGTARANVAWMKLAEPSRHAPERGGAILPPPPPEITAETFYNDNPHLIDAAVAALVSPLRRPVA